MRKKRIGVKTLRQLNKLTSRELSKYIDEVVSGYSQKQPTLNKRLVVKGKDEPFSLDSVDVQQLGDLLKKRIAYSKKHKYSFGNDNGLKFTYETFEPYIRMAASSVETYVRVITSGRVDEYIRSILSKDFIDDFMVLNVIKEKFSPRDWEMFFQSKYFQQVYINGSDKNTSSSLQEFNETNVNDYGFEVSPWVQRLMDFAKSRKIELDFE